MNSIIIKLVSFVGTMIMDTEPVLCSVGEKGEKGITTLRNHCPLIWNHDLFVTS